MRYMSNKYKIISQYVLAASRWHAYHLLRIAGAHDKPVYQVGHQVFTLERALLTLFLYRQTKQPLRLKALDM